MADMDDILGGQQDELARLRYEMVKACEGREDFKHCRTVFDVYRRMYELHGEEAVKANMEQTLRQQNPSFGDAAIWATRILEQVVKGDKTKFERIYEQALLAAIRDQQQTDSGD